MNATVLMTNEKLGKRLVYCPGMKNVYALQMRLNAGPKTEWLTTATGKILTKKLTKYFHWFQIDSAKAQVYAINYVNRKFKA